MTAVTVLLPVRDGAAFLDAAMDSVLRQDLADFELLAVDDGSTDATPGMLARYARGDRRVRVLTTPPRGLVRALNLGLAEAGAPYVARMDADDIAAPERLSLQRAALDGAPGVALVASGWRVIGPTGRVRRIVHAPTSPSGLAAELAVRNCVAHASVMFRRDVVRAAGGYRPAFRLAEDYDLWRRLGELHAMIALPDLLLDHREHPGQSTLAGLEQRILSELGVHAAASRRALGGPDGLDGEEPVSRADLVRLGMSHEAIRRGMLDRAVGAAEHAAAAGYREPAAAAIALARRQRGLSMRMHLHLAALRVRARVSKTDWRGA